MELWLDTIDFELITKYTNQLSITGITTNPSILAKSSLSARVTIEKLLVLQAGKVAVQVTLNNYPDMFTQAKMLAAIDPRIIIKIPITNDGLYTIHALSKIGIQTMATAIFETSQILLGAMAGATYAAPYLGKIKGDNFAVLQDMLDIIKVNNYPLKLIVAAIKNKEQIVHATKLGAQAITIPADPFREFMANLNETTDSLMQFDRDWMDSGKSLNS